MIGVGPYIGIGPSRKSSKSSGSSSASQYLFDDTAEGGTTYMREVVRMQGVDEIYCVDIALTPLGFAGVEGTDFEMIYGNII
jgi:hypothetical protein